MKVKPYQFGLATISGFRDHSNVPRLRTNRNQLVNIYLMKNFRNFKGGGKERTPNPQYTSAEKSHGTNSVKLACLLLQQCLFKDQLISGDQFGNLT